MFLTAQNSLVAYRPAQERLARVFRNGRFYPLELSRARLNRFHAVSKCSKRRDPDLLLPPAPCWPLLRRGGSAILIAFLLRYARLSRGAHPDGASGFMAMLDSASLRKLDRLAFWARELSAQFPRLMAGSV